jgi:sulfoxide reductase heme-binding subunit YedZ
MPRLDRRWLHAGAVALAALPLAGLALRAVGDGLGANPIEEITHTTGLAALRLLLLALLVSPLRRWFGWSWAAPLRRTLGLLAFGYACLHLLTWVALDQFFDWRAMLEDVRKRRYIVVGAATFLMLLPLAVTSTRAWQRRLGRRWVLLHRLVYVAAAGAIVHYLWLVKADVAPPLAYAAALALLLALRAPALRRLVRSRAGRPRRRSPAPEGPDCGPGRGRWSRARPCP